MSDRIPKVTREDVSRVIRRDFRGHNPDLIFGILDRYGSEEWQRKSEKNRVHLAILKLSGGDFYRLRSLVDLACSDFRDVIAPAEYPGYLAVDFADIKKLSHEEKERLMDGDWEQYQEWLNGE